MTARSAMQSASVRLIGQRPAAFFGSAGKFEMEMCDLVNEVAQDVMKYRDWQNLIRRATITGDGTETDFALPGDYDRMLLNSDVQDTAGWAWGYFRFNDINEFIFQETRGFTPWPGGWILYGNELRFSPAPTGDATYPYITKNIVTSATGDKAEFTDDLDEFRLPERLLTLGLVWRWRENKGLASTGDQESFIKALDEYAAKDGGSRVQRRNSRRFIPGVSVGWPWTLGPT